MRIRQEADTASEIVSQTDRESERERKDEVEAKRVCGPHTHETTIFFFKPKCSSSSYLSKVKEEPWFCARAAEENARAARAGTNIPE